jgi:hypothetical protein
MAEPLAHKRKARLRWTKDQGRYMALCGTEDGGELKLEWEQVMCPGCLARRGRRQRTRRQGADRRDRGWENRD